MGRKSAMAYPAPTPSGPSSGSSLGPRSASRPPVTACAAPSPRPAAVSPRCQTPARTPAEGEHQREKLQFALAVALTRGDLARSQQLRDQIAALGDELEEPGT